MAAKFKSEGAKSEGVSRRGLLKAAAVAPAAAAAVATASQPAAGEEGTGTEFPTRTVTLTINGEARQMAVEPRCTLAFLLREKLDLTGAKIGCDRGMCGMCTVIMNGMPVYSCHTLAVQADGKDITTIEGLSDGYNYDDLHPLQKAFVDKMGFQCAYCTSAQILTAKTLLDRNSKPTLEEVKWNQRGVFCRCGCYPKIFKAVLEAAQMEGYKDPEKVSV